MIEFAVTVICAYVDQSSYSIGSDSGAFSDSGTQVVSATPKIYKVEGWLLGVAGSFRVVNAVSKLQKGNPEAVRDVLMKELTGDVGEWSILFASASGVFELAEDFSIIEFVNPYASIGAGGDVALGALAVLSTCEMSSRQIVKAALSVTEEHHTVVLGPHKILTVNT